MIVLCSLCSFRNIRTLEHWCYCGCIHHPLICCLLPGWKFLWCCGAPLLHKEKSQTWWRSQQIWWDRNRRKCFLRTFDVMRTVYLCMHLCIIYSVDYWIHALQKHWRLIEHITQHVMDASLWLHAEPWPRPPSIFCPCVLISLANKAWIYLP